jgi:hypothetical protein
MGGLFRHGADKHKYALRLSALLCNTPWTWASPSSTSFIMMGCGAAATPATAGQGQTPKAQRQSVNDVINVGDLKMTWS